MRGQVAFRGGGGGGAGAHSPQNLSHIPGPFLPGSGGRNSVGFVCDQGLRPQGRVPGCFEALPPSSFGDQGMVTVFPMLLNLGLEE